MQIKYDNVKPRELGQKLRKIFDERGANQLSIAAHTGIDQSQISRILNGSFSRVDGRNVQKLCDYANIVVNKTHDIPPDPRKSELLMDALSNVWDGTVKKERAIAKLIRSLEPLVKNDS